MQYITVMRGHNNRQMLLNEVPLRTYIWAILSYIILSFNVLNSTLVKRCLITCLQTPGYSIRKIQMHKFGSLMIYNKILNSYEILFFNTLTFF